MCLSPELRAELIRDEGLKLKAYKDSNGYWTIGVGHLLGDKPYMVSITQDEADALLAWDAKNAEKLARQCVPAFPSLDPARQRALINMAFNRGRHMVDSTTITPAIVKASETGDWSKLPAIIAASEWAKQVGARATRLAQVLLGNEQGTTAP